MGHATLGGSTALSLMSQAKHQNAAATQLQMQHTSLMQQKGQLASGSAAQQLTANTASTAGSQHTSGHPTSAATSQPSGSAAQGSSSQQTGAASSSTGQASSQQTQPKIPVICGFHKQMLLLTCQYFTQQSSHSQTGYNPSAPPSYQGKHGGGGASSHVQLSQIRRIRNKNPNCNHNSNSVFY